MNNTKKKFAGGVAAAMALGAAVALAQGADGSATKSTESSVVTNDNGTVTRTVRETNVSTNGNMETMRVRVTTTTLDPKGNLLFTKTAETASSKTDNARYWTIDDYIDGTIAVNGLVYPLICNGRISAAPADAKLIPAREIRISRPGLVLGTVELKNMNGGEKKSGKPAERPDFSFLGVKFGATMAEAGVEEVKDEPRSGILPPSPSARRLRSSARDPFAALGSVETKDVKPQKSLDGFDRYCAGLMPKTGRIAAYFAGARAGSGGHAPDDFAYIFDALKKKYGEPTTYEPEPGLAAGCRSASWTLEGGRSITLKFLEMGYYAMITVMDSELFAQAEQEAEEVEMDRVRTAEEQRKQRLEKAVEAF